MTRDKHKVGVISLLPDHVEGGPWMGRHQVLSRLSKQFHVVWMNPAEEWRRLWPKTDAYIKYAKTGFHHHPSGLIIFNPGKYLPKIYSPKYIGGLFDKLGFRIVRSYLASLGCERIVVYLTRPEQSPALDLCRFDLSCYHVFDDYSFSEEKVPTNPIEMDLISRCDLPIFSSNIMMAEKGEVNKNSILLPNGVDTELFSKRRIAPSDLASIPHPRIGYSGVIKKQLNLPLLLNLATARPLWNFVFVGPIMNVSGYEGEVKALKKLDNVFFLGNKIAEDLPAYIQNFDVGLMCYMQNSYTRYITPLKLNEYLASRIPVVATRLEPLIQFQSNVYLVDTEREWLNAIERCIAKDEETLNKLKNVHDIIDDYDWNKLVTQLSNTILSKLN